MDRTGTPGDASPSHPGHLVEARQVVRTYGSGATAVAALRGIDLVASRGRLVALRGRSGSGKTTLLNLLGGLDRPDGGEVCIAGRELGRMSDGELSRLRRQTLGFVFQSFSLLPTFSAYENVELALRLGGDGRRRERTREVLAMVGLGDKAKHRPFELSGGEQQRVVIARALANRPQVLLADEPTGQLDSGTGLAIWRLFRKVVDDEGVTAIIATHDPAVSEVADETHYMRDGRLERETG